MSHYTFFLSGCIQVPGALGMTPDPHHCLHIWYLHHQHEWFIVKLFLVLIFKMPLAPPALSACPMLCGSMVWSGRLVPLAQGWARCKVSFPGKLPSFPCFSSLSPLPSTWRIIFTNKTAVGSYIILFFSSSKTLYFEPFPFLKDFKTTNWGRDILFFSAVIAWNEGWKWAEIIERNRARE